MPFLGLTSKTLLQNPSLQRMPTTQRQWIDFIKELDTHLAGETDAFTPTWTGFSSDPSGGVVYWKKVGTLVVMSFSISAVGTSNATTFSITGIPTAVTPISGGTAVQIVVPIVGVVDNGTESWGTAAVNSSSIINFGFKDTDFTSWTNSGNKGFNTSASTKATIMYDTKYTAESV